MIMKELAQKMAEFYFKDSSDSVLENKMLIEVEDKYIEFDLSTLCVYRCNLDCYEFRLLGVYLNELITLKKEEDKERSERKVLLDYINLTGRYSDYKIRKCVKPDFILEKDNKRIGVEITELTDCTFKILDKIDRKYNDGKNSSEEIIRLAVEEHGQKARKFEYIKLGERTMISSGAHCLDNKTVLFAQNIDAKLKKYEKIACQFTKMVIVCATPGIEITNKYEVKRLFEIVSYKPNHPIEVVVLVEDVAYSMVFGNVEGNS